MYIRSILQGRWSVVSSMHKKCASSLPTSSVCKVAVIVRSAPVGCLAGRRLSLCPGYRCMSSAMERSPRLLGSWRCLQAANTLAPEARRRAGQGSRLVHERLRQAGRRNEIFGVPAFRSTSFFFLIASLIPFSHPCMSRRPSRPVKAQRAGQRRRTSAYRGAGPRIARRGISGTYS